MLHDVALKYRAFISYSQADAAWAQWLHRRIEYFPIDTAWVGRATPAGPLPANLRPVFRDRHEFQPGQPLATQSMTALKASGALIVVCSPASARSEHVNEEIRLFKHLNPDKPVIPVIVAGSPTDPEQNCFGPSLRFALNADGTLSDRPLNIIAADIREGGDGRELALAKVVAAVIGQPPDTVYDRAARVRRRNLRIRAAVGVVIAGLGLATALFGWSTYQKSRLIADVQDIVAQYSPVGSANASAPESREQLTRAITAIAEGAGRDPRYARALELLKLGKHREAAPLLEQVAQAKAQRATENRKTAVAAYLDLGAIAGLGDPAQARQAYAKALELAPDNVIALYWHGYLHYLAGDLTTASNSLKRLRLVAERIGDKRHLALAQLRLGSVEAERGDSARARTLVADAVKLARQELAANPADPARIRDLSVAQLTAGTVQRRTGQFDAARRSFDAALELVDKLLATEPGNRQWQSDRTTVLLAIGNIQADENKLAEAAQTYRQALDVRAKLAQAAPENASLARDLSVAHERIGQLQELEGQRDLAKASFEASLAIAETLAKKDKLNARWQDDLSVALEKFANILNSQGNVEEALKHYERALLIRQQLVKQNPGNARFSRSLGLANETLGYLRRSQGKHAAALEHYMAYLGAAKALASKDKISADAQRDMMIGHYNVGETLIAMQRFKAALPHYRSGLQIAEALAAKEPQNTLKQNDRALANLKMGTLSRRTSDVRASRKYFTEAIRLLTKMADNDPSNTQWQNDLAEAFHELGELELSVSRLDDALAAFTRAYETRKRLTGIDAKNVVWSGDCAKSALRIAMVHVQTKQIDRARPFYDEAIARAEALTKSVPGNADFQALLRDARKLSSRFPARPGEPRR